MINLPILQGYFKMLEKIKFPNAIINELVFNIPASAKLTISVNNANGKYDYDPNKTQFLILYRSKNDDNISAAGHESIEKLITAVKINRGAVAVINQSINNQLSFTQLKNNIQLKTIICLGVTPEMLRLYVEYQLYSILIYSEITMVYCEDIDEMDKQKKTVLWNRLQTIFNL